MKFDKKDGIYKNVDSVNKEKKYVSSNFNIINTV